jgi:hypothetical protein
VSSKPQTSGIMGLKPYPLDRYGSIDLNRLTVFTIHLLNELDIPTTLENIGVANFRMFPRRFALVGFPDYPDVTRVNRALLQLRPKYRNWAMGNAKLGWHLTVAGEEEAKALLRKLGDNRSAGLDHSSGDTEAEPSGKNKRTVHAEDTTGRIRASPLFAKYREGWKDVDPLEVYDVLEAYTHTPPDALRHRLRRMKNSAASIGDKEVSAFLEELGRRFAPMFERR